MPWFTPTLRDVRSFVRDHVRASLPGADASIPNSVLRVMTDSQGALCHLTLQYIDWLALQLLPDTAEDIWLGRHGDIWLTNSDGTTGRKMATFAQGTVNFIGEASGIIIPAGTRLSSGASGTLVEYETLDQLITGLAGTAVPGEVRALDPGVNGNVAAGASLSLDTPTGVQAIAVDITGGVDTENDDDLRVRVLQRIRQPPQGGALHDYVRWSLAVPGCTRAWCYPLEMGIGTVSVRVMFDDLRADNDGFPIQQDLNAVEGYLDTVRPVAVKDFWVLSPIKQRIEAYINDLNPDTPEVRAAIEANMRAMLLQYAKPGQTIYAAWKYAAISSTPDVVSFAMATALDDVMQSPGHMAVLGDIVYGTGFIPHG